MDSNKKFLSAEEVASEFGLDAASLKEFVDAGEVRALADRGTWKYRRDELEELVAAGRIEPLSADYEIDEEMLRPESSGEVLEFIEIDEDALNEQAGLDLKEAKEESDPDQDWFVPSDVPEMTASPPSPILSSSDVTIYSGAEGAPSDSDISLSASHVESDVSLPPSSAFAQANGPVQTEIESSSEVTIYAGPDETSTSSNIELPQSAVFHQGDHGHAEIESSSEVSVYTGPNEPPVGDSDIELPPSSVVSQADNKSREEIGSSSEVSVYTGTDEEPIGDSDIELSPSSALSQTDDREHAESESASDVTVYTGENGTVIADSDIEVPPSSVFPQAASHIQTDIESASDVTVYDEQDRAVVADSEVSLHPSSIQIVDEQPQSQFESISEIAVFGGPQDVQHSDSEITFSQSAVLQGEEGSHFADSNISLQPSSIIYDDSMSSEFAGSSNVAFIPAEELPQVDSEIALAPSSMFIDMDSPHSNIQDSADVAIFAGAEGIPFVDSEISLQPSSIYSSDIDSEIQISDEEDVHFGYDEIRPEDSGIVLDFHIDSGATVSSSGSSLRLPRTADIVSTSPEDYSIPDNLSGLEGSSGAVGDDSDVHIVDVTGSGVKLRAEESGIILDDGAHSGMPGESALIDDVPRADSEFGEGGIILEPSEDDSAYSLEAAGPSSFGDADDSETLLRSMKEDSRFSLEPLSSSDARDDSGIALDSLQEDSGFTLDSSSPGLGEESGISAQTLSSLQGDSGFSLEPAGSGRDDSGISLDSDDNDLLLTEDSGIALSGLDSGLGFHDPRRGSRKKPGASDLSFDDNSGTLKDGDLFSTDLTDDDESTSGVDMTRELINDSAFEMESGADGTAELILDEDDDSADPLSQTIVKKGPTTKGRTPARTGLSGAFELDASTVEDLEISDALDSGADVEEFVEDEDAVLDASDEVFSGDEVEAVGGEEDDLKPAVAAKKKRVVPLEPAWGVDMTVGLVCCSLVLAANVLVMWSGVSTMWTGAEPLAPAAPLISSLAGMIGK